MPTKDEFVAVVDNYWKKSVNNTAGSWLSSDFLMPFAGYRNYSSAGVNDQGFNGLYWSSSRYNTYFAYYLGCSSTDLNPQYAYDRAVGLSVRCFKNTSDPNLTIHPNG